MAEGAEKVKKFSMENIIGLLICLAIIVLVLRGRNNRDNAHPYRCDICGNMNPETITLKDGHICYKCAEVKYRYKTIDLPIIIKDSRFRTISVNEMKNYIDSIRQRGELMESFVPTRTSPDGLIKVDDRLGLFTIDLDPENTFAHYIRDIESFRLVIDKNYTNISDSILIDGGHIAIKLREPIEDITITYGSNRDSFGARHEVKQSLEPDLKFLEQITGLRRR